MLKKLLMSATMLLASVQLSSAADLGSMSWDEIVAQAKEEGELTWYVWYFQDDFRREVKAFEEAYGIKVTIPVTTLDGNTEKLMAERGAGHRRYRRLCLGLGSAANRHPSQSVQ